MKSVSVKKLSDLEKEGWKISSTDKNAITAQIGVTNAAAAIAVSLENIKDEIAKVKFPESEKIGPLLDNHYKLMIELLSNFAPQEFKPKKFDVIRTQKGVIDHIIVKEV